MTKPPPLSEIVAKAQEQPGKRMHGRGAYSPLFRWMRRHHDGLQEAIDKMGWAALTDAITDAGILNGQGNSPPAETVRHTWWRVRKAVRRERAKAADNAAAPRKAKPQPQVRDALPPQPEKPAEPDPDAAERVRMAKERVLKYMNR
jgi:hypothetical protein